MVALDSSPRRPFSSLAGGLAFSRLRSIDRLAPGVVGASWSLARQQVRPVSRPAAGLRSSRARQQDRPVSRPAVGLRSSRARCCRTARWRLVVASLLGLGAGSGQGCERRILSARLCGWGIGGARRTWCQGLGFRGGGPGGGGAVLMGRARASVLPGCHGRVGGVVAGVWRSVAVSVGRGENLFYLRTDRRRRSSFPS